MFIPHPIVWGMVAEIGGRVVGSNFLDERGPIRGVGPITVAPQGQNSGVGRKLMRAVLERGEGAPGIRLLQDAFHMRSLSLYESLGFDVKEPVALATGRPRSEPDRRVEVRQLEENDLEECEALCRHVHGYERTNELRDAVQAFTPFVAVREWGYRRLRIDDQLLADESRSREERRRHEGAALGVGDRRRRAARVPRTAAFEPISVVSRGRPAACQADEPDGARRLPRSTGRLVPVGLVLTSPAADRGVTGRPRARHLRRGARYSDIRARIDADSFRGQPIEQCRTGRVRSGRDSRG